MSYTGSFYFPLIIKIIHSNMYTLLDTEYEILNSQKYERTFQS